MFSLNPLSDKYVKMVINIPEGKNYSTRFPQFSTGAWYNWAGNALFHFFLNNRGDTKTENFTWQIKIIPNMSLIKRVHLLGNASAAPDIIICTLGTTFTCFLTPRQASQLDFRHIGELPLFSKPMNILHKTLAAFTGVKKREKTK